MNLNELYRRLSYGELSNLSISSEGSGSIVSGKRPTVVLLANEALRELSKRFVLREKTLLIEQIEGLTTYRLEPMYSVQNAEISNVDQPYIVDSEDEPFNDPVLKIIQVYDHWGREMPLNDRDNFWSLFTPQNNILQVPNPQAGLPLSVNYQTFIKPILGTDLEETIDIPVVLEKALTSYIAGHILGNMNTQESNAKSQEHLLRFEAICAEAEDKDLLSISSSNTNTKFEKRGWA
jgi:hypothetical protein